MHVCETDRIDRSMDTIQTRNQPVGFPTKQSTTTSTQRMSLSDQIHHKLNGDHHHHHHHGDDPSSDARRLSSRPSRDHEAWLEDGDKEEHVPTPAERRRLLETTPLGKLEQRAEGLQAELDDLQLALSSAIVAVEERQRSSSRRLSFVAKSAVGVRSSIHEKLETREQKQKSSNELARELGEVAGWRAPCPLVVRTMFSLVV